MHSLAYSTASLQSAQIEPWSLYVPLFDQLIHNALLESSPSLNSMQQEFVCGVSSGHIYIFLM